MEETTEESLPPKAVRAISLCNTEFKSKENCICKIIGKNAGTGFFSKIEYEGVLIPVLITNYHVIDDNYMEQNEKLKYYINDESYVIDINKDSKIYSSSNYEYDIMIIRLKEGQAKAYLKIDNNIFKDNSENNYCYEDIYILHYANGKEAKISFGKGIEKIDAYDIKHECHTEQGSSGGPILSRITDMVIGIHKGSKKIDGKCVYNRGTFLKFPLNELKNKKSANLEPKYIYFKTIIAKKPYVCIQVQIPGECKVTVRTKMIEKLYYITIKGNKMLKMNKGEDKLTSFSKREEGDFNLLIKLNPEDFPLARNKPEKDKTTNENGLYSYYFPLVEEDDDSNIDED